MLPYWPDLPSCLGDALWFQMVKIVLKLCPKLPFILFYYMKAQILLSKNMAFSKQLVAEKWLNFATAFTSPRLSFVLQAGLGQRFLGSKKVSRN